MWEIVAGLKASGVTIILTTHYIEVEAIADRIGVIAKGELLLVEEKHALMARMGEQLEVQLTEPITGRWRCNRRTWNCPPMGNADLHL